ncbi:MAG: hypothetical protein ABSD49_15550 [Candidatus Bathyarchaeia archaeon]
MVVRRTGMIIAFLILLSPVTAIPVVQVIGLKNVSTQVTTDESTLAYTNTLMHTYYGASNGTTVAQTAVSFPARVIGFMAPRGLCGFFSLPVPVKSGTLLTVEMTANNPVNFYLLSDYPSSGSGSCKVSSNPIVAENNFTDFTLHWTAPEDGIFYFVFTGPTGVILLADHGSVRPVEQSATITYPTSIETMLSTYSTTTTVSSAVTITTPLYLQATSQYGLLIIGVLIALLAIALIALARRTH